MAGREFGIQASWTEIFKKLLPDQANSDNLRQASSIAESLNQQIEEFINRYTVTASDDEGALDLAGETTVAGTITLDSLTGVFRTDVSPNARTQIAHPTVNGYRGIYFYSGESDEDFPAYIGRKSVANVDTVQIASADQFDGGLGAGNPSTIDLTTNGTIVLTPGNGQSALTIGGAGGSLTVDHFYADGTAGTTSAASFGWDGDNNTGFYRVGADDIGVTAGGTRVAGFITTGTQTLSGNTPTTPGYSFIQDPNTGMYNESADVLAFSTGGTKRFLIHSLGWQTAATGTAAQPAWTFQGDTNTGIYRDQADVLRFTTGGVLAFTINSTASVGVEDGTGKNPQLYSADRTTASRIHIFYGDNSVGYLFNTTDKFYFGASTCGPVAPATTTNTTTWRVTAHGTVTNGYQLDRPSSSIVFKDNIENIDGAQALALLRQMRPVRYEGTEDVEVATGKPARNPWRDPDINDWCPIHGPNIVKGVGGPIPERMINVNGKMKRGDFDQYTHEELDGFTPCYDHPDYFRMPQYGFIAEEQRALDPLLTEYHEDSITDAPTVALLTAAIDHMAARLDAAGI